MHLSFRKQFIYTMTLSVRNDYPVPKLCRKYPNFSRDKCVIGALCSIP